MMMMMMQHGDIGTTAPIFMIAIIPCEVKVSRRFHGMVVHVMILFHTELLG